MSCCRLKARLQWHGNRIPWRLDRAAGDLRAKLEDRSCGCHRPALRCDAEKSAVLTHCQRARGQSAIGAILFRAERIERRQFLALEPERSPRLRYSVFCISASRTPDSRTGRRATCPELDLKQSGKKRFTFAGNRNAKRLEAAENLHKILNLAGRGVLA